MTLEWRQETRKLSDLKSYERNPRKISGQNLDKLQKHLEEFGMAGSLVINSDGTLIGGHQRLKALKKLKIREVQVSVPSRELSLNEIKRLNILLNRSSGEFDWKILVDDFKVSELTDIGFNADELLHITGPKGQIVEDDFEEKPPKAPQTQTGDVYQLGQHRLRCGSCTECFDVEALMGDELADIVVTDPPYGANYSDKNKMLNLHDKGNRIERNIINDDITNYRNFFSSFLKRIPFKNYNTVYVFMLGSELHSLRLAFDDADIKWGDYLIWVKNCQNLSRKDYNPKHEFVIYGWKGLHRFHAKEPRTTILNYNKPEKSDLHPTMKPIKLLAQIIEDGSPERSIVYDGFGGSGSTLIAAEQTNRKCRMLEIDPGYCDVIVKRWVQYRKKCGEDSTVIRNDSLVTEEFEVSA